MIVIALKVILGAALLVIVICVVVVALHREPGGHGRHATRRVLMPEYDKPLKRLPAIPHPPWSTAPMPRVHAASMLPPDLPGAQSLATARAGESPGRAVPRPPRGSSDLPPVVAIATRPGLIIPPSRQVPPPPLYAALFASCPLDELERLLDNDRELTAAGYLT